jgi:hypothetical protein
VNGTQIDEPAFPVEASSHERQLAPEEKRSLFCPEYSSCLLVAAVRDWRDWSCRSCPRCAHTRPDLLAYAHQRRGGGTEG